jgi:hypothetical protein
VLAASIIRAIRLHGTTPQKTAIFESNIGYIVDIYYRVIKKSRNPFLSHVLFVKKLIALK